MKAPTVLGDALRDFADLADLHQEWDVFACLISKGGVRLNFQGLGGESEPVEVARCLFNAVDIYAGTPEEERDSIHPLPFD
jgi:hypothetical protein